MDKLLSKLTYDIDDFEITVMSEDSNLHSKFKGFKNIKFKSWVKDYEKFFK